MAHLGVRLRDIPSAYGWDALAVLFKHAPRTSATWRWLHKDEADFGSDLKRSAMLADIFDAIQWQTYAISCIYSKQKPREPKRYPRPWLDEEKSQTIGSEPISVADFNDWYYKEA